MKPTTHIVTRRSNNESRSKQTPVGAKPSEINLDLGLLSKACSKNIQSSAQTAITAPTISNHKKSSCQAMANATPIAKTAANYLPLNNKTNIVSFLVLSFFARKMIIQVSTDLCSHFYRKLIITKKSPPSLTSIPKRSSRRRPLLRSLPLVRSGETL